MIIKLPSGKYLEKVGDKTYQLKDAEDSFVRFLNEFESEFVASSFAAGVEQASRSAHETPSSLWNALGNPDPHGNSYDTERASLALGKLTDDELANAIFLYGNSKPAIKDISLGQAHMPIVYLSAGKDRIRWLSRSLSKALQAQPLIRATFETTPTDKLDAIGSTAAPVKRVDKEDDGSYTVVIDHWPSL